MILHVYVIKENVSRVECASVILVSRALAVNSTLMNAVQGPVDVSTIV